VELKAESKVCKNCARWSAAYGRKDTLGVCSDIQMMKTCDSPACVQFKAKGK
jgi:hypothetical protein